jgi:hypothetical protein
MTRSQCNVVRIKPDGMPTCDTRKALRELENDVCDVVRGVGLALLAEEDDSLTLFALEQLEQLDGSFKEKIPLRDGANVIAGPSAACRDRSHRSY